MISKKVLAKKVKESIPGWLFILPTVAGLCIFTLAPIIQSVMYSFHDYDMTTKYDFVGLGNYIKMFRDPAVRTAFWNTLIFGAGNIAMVLVLTYALALLLNLKIPGIKIFRVVYYLPCVIPAIAGGILWSNIMKYGTESPGIFNQIRMFFGLSPSSYFFSSDLEAIRSILVMNLWSLGGGTIIWLAAFKNIPEQLYEAAEIDGAGRGRRLISITIPMCTPMIFYNLIMNIIGSLQTFGSVYTLTGGSTGEENSLLFYLMKVYNDAFNFQGKTMGYACAESWVLFLIIAALTAVVFKTSKWVFYGEES